MRFLKTARDELLLWVMLTSFVFFMLIHIDISCFNLSDGVYLYLSKALSQGGHLYKDIYTSPSPVIFSLGALIYRFSDFLSGVSWYKNALLFLPYFRTYGVIPEAYSLVLFRAFSILVFAFNSWLVYRIAFRLYKIKTAAFLAALIVLFLPYGALESRTFMISPLLNLFSLCSLYFFLGASPVALIFAGVFSWAALFTKIVYLPVLILNLAFLYATDKKLLLSFSSGFFSCLLFSFAVFMSKFSVPEAFLGQLASEALHNIDIVRMGVKYLEAFRWEGGFFVLCLFGLYFLLKDYKQNIYFILYAIATIFIPVISMSHLGTFQAIFVIAEPVIAISAAICIHKIFVYLRNDMRSLSISTSEGIVKAAVILCLCFLALMSFYPVQISIYNFTMSNAPEIAQARQTIQNNSESSEPVLASGYFAYISSRYIFEHIADQYIFLSRYKRHLPSALRQYERVLNGLKSGQIKIAMYEPSGCMGISELAALIQADYKQVFSARSLLLLPMPRIWALKDDRGVNEK